jgi:LuxR family maltose regulon positive regulatory protein
MQRALEPGAPEDAASAEHQADLGPVRPTHPYKLAPGGDGASATGLRGGAGSHKALRAEYFEPVAVVGNDLGAPLLRTKLVVPSSPRLVVREGLIDALSEGLPQPLTLVYGPAGSGKTMLVAQWAASVRDERRIAWLWLEVDDNDPARFWMYVIEALRSVVPGIGEASLAMLRAPGVNLVEEAFPALINELAAVAEQFVLVLDDYHVIEDERIHEGMASFIEHLPTTLRIVMTSRVEPPLRVGTLRARAQLNEVDAGQLRFSVFRSGVDAQ